LLELFGGAAGNRCDFLGRVSRVVCLEKLENAARVFEGLVDAGVAIRAAFILPGGFVVLPAVRVPTGEVAVLKREPLGDDERRVGVFANVAGVELIVGERVVEQTAEERDVGAGADLDVLVGDGGGAVEARVDADELRLAVTLRFHHEAETDGVIFGRVPPHHQHHIGVGYVSPTVGHGSAAKRGSQTGYRWAVSKTGLVFIRQDPEAEPKLPEQVVDLVRVGAAADDRDVIEAIDGAA
jgi:hypothetical protein